MLPRTLVMISALGTFWVQQILERIDWHRKEYQDDTFFGAIHEKYWFVWIR